MHREIHGEMEIQKLDRQRRPGGKITRERSWLLHWIRTRRIKPDRVSFP